MAKYSKYRSSNQVRKSLPTREQARRMASNKRYSKKYRTLLKDIGKNKRITIAGGKRRS